MPRARSSTAPAPARRWWRRTVGWPGSAWSCPSRARGPTLIHVGERTQELNGIFSPYLLGFDGETVTFTARTLIRGEWRSADSRPISDPPRRTGTSPRFARYYSPSGENWYGFRVAPWAGDARGIHGDRGRPAHAHHGGTVLGGRPAPADLRARRADGGGTDRHERQGLDRRPRCARVAKASRSWAEDRGLQVNRRTVAPWAAQVGRTVPRSRP